MIPSHRQWFNRNYGPRKYARFLSLLQLQCGEPVPFRHSETPVFLPASLVARMAQYGREMVEQLLANPQYQHDSAAAVPPAFRVPHEDPRPLFVQADFGLDADLQPKLVEIQGFPTLYAYQPVMAAAYRDAYDIDSPVTQRDRATSHFRQAAAPQAHCRPAKGSALPMLPGGIEAEEYTALLRRAIVADHDPQNVVLLEIDPSHQKTRADFLFTERLFGVRTVDIAEVRQEGRRLFHNGTPIRRIYNRAIMDELVRKRVRLEFDFRDELDVEWAGHPNWFFRLSKFSLPYLDHPAVPRTVFLDRAGPIAHPENYVLKPLYSFAGAGVIVGPTAEQLDTVPEARRAGYILQERVNFLPTIETPYGPTKIEVRIMYLWLDELRPINTIIRMGRGAQMGVDHNQGQEWVGASAAFIDPDC